MAVADIEIDLTRDCGSYQNTNRTLESMYYATGYQTASVLIGCVISPGTGSGEHYAPLGGDSGAWIVQSKHRPNAADMRWMEEEEVRQLSPVTFPFRCLCASARFILCVRDCAAAVAVHDIIGAVSASPAHHCGDQCVHHHSHRRDADVSALPRALHQSAAAHCIGCGAAGIDRPAADADRRALTQCPHLAHAPVSALQTRLPPPHRAEQDAGPVCQRA